MISLHAIKVQRTNRAGPTVGGDFAGSRRSWISPWILGAVLGLKCRSSRIREGRASSTTVPSAACTPTGAQCMTPQRKSPLQSHPYLTRDKFEMDREVPGSKKSARSNGSIEGRRGSVLSIKLEPGIGSKGKLEMGNFDALYKKNWKHPNYDREMKLKIIAAKLVQEVTNGDRKASVVEESLISSAALLILTTFQMEQDFIIQDGSTPDPKYLSTVNCLRATLDKLKVFPASPGGKKGNGDGGGLARIING